VGICMEAKKTIDVEDIPVRNVGFNAEPGPRGPGSVQIFDEEVARVWPLRIRSFSRHNPSASRRVVRQPLSPDPCPRSNLLRETRVCSTDANESPAFACVFRHNESPSQCQQTRATPVPRYNPPMPRETFLNKFLLIGLLALAPIHAAAKAQIIFPAHL
jgi:hypothetical protein